MFCMYNLSQFFQSTRPEGGRGVFFSEPFFLSLSDRRKRGGVKEGLAGPFFFHFFFLFFFCLTNIYILDEKTLPIAGRGVFFVFCFLGLLEDVGEWGWGNFLRAQRNCS